MEDKGLNPTPAFEIYYDLKSSPQAALLRTILISKYSNKPFSQNRLCALPVKLLRHLMTISNAKLGLKDVFYSNNNDGVINPAYR